MGWTLSRQVPDFEPAPVPAPVPPKIERSEIEAEEDEPRAARRIEVFEGTVGT